MMSNDEFIKHFYAQLANGYDEWWVSQTEQSRDWMAARQAEVNWQVDKAYRYAGMQVGGRS